MNKVLCHKNLIRIQRLAQQMLAHVRDRLFAQLWAVAQSPAMALELWHAASQQHLAEPLRCLPITLPVKRTDCQNQFDLADLIAALRRSAVQANLQCGVTRINHLFPPIFEAQESVLCFLSSLCMNYSSRAW